MDWVLWCVLLLAQNAAFVTVSRARNSSSLLYHGIGAVFSNGIWIVSQFIVVNKFMEAKAANDMSRLTFVVVFYVLWTTTGALTMHWLLVNKIEKGKASLKPTSRD